MDWNWFFSAVAQSFAAIVGIGGAFVYTKLLSTEGEFKRSRADIERLLTESDSLRDRIQMRDIGGHIERARRSAAREWEPGKKEEEFFVDAQARISDYDVREEAGAAIIELLNPENPKGVHSQTWLDAVYDNSLPNQQEEVRIDQVTSDLQSHIRRARNLQTTAKAQPFSSKSTPSILTGLAALFVAGVIWPLAQLPIAPGRQLEWSLLPASDAPIKWLMLSVGVIVFGLFIFMLSRIHGGLRFSGQMLRALEDVSQPAYYSEYMRNWFHNKGVLEERVESGADNN